MVFSVTFNKNSVKLWWSVLFVASSGIRTHNILVVGNYSKAKNISKI